MNRMQTIASVAFVLILSTGCKDKNETQLASDYDKGAQARPAVAPPSLGESDATGRERPADPKGGMAATLSGHASPGSAGGSPSPMVTGKVVETFDAATYSYMRLANNTGETWAAIPKTPVTVGQTLELSDIAWMQDFASPTLGRKFERIAFAGRAVLIKDGGAGDRREDTPAPNGSAGASLSQIDKAGASSSPRAASPHATAGGGVTVKPGDVAKLEGGLTVAELFAQKENLVGKTIRVRAKVVKANANILGSNWYHIQDGTGEAESNDITITSPDAAKVGDTVVVEGVLGVNKDIGSGYFFPIIIEKAKVTAEKE